MEMDVSLLNFVVMEYMFGTLKSSLPRLWNLGKKYFAQLEEKWWQNLKKQYAKYVVLRQEKNKFDFQMKLRRSITEG